MTTNRSRPHARPLALGLLLGAALDRVVPDPPRGHPVALFGRAAGALEAQLHAPTRARGATFTALALTPVVALGVGAESDPRPWRRAAVTGLATWAVVGGAMLEREALLLAGELEAGDLPAARRRLPHLCGRDPRELDPADLARATVESVAENTSDAVTAPLLWGGLFGVPGLLGYRAVNTLDAMVGHRGDRYERFGWCAARLDDVANWAPARLTAVLAVVAAPLVAGSPVAALRAWRRDGHHHPSPNAGQCESAFAGALGVRLGGTNVYGSRIEHRPDLGEGRQPETRDIRRAVRLARAVGLGAAAASALLALVTASRRPRRRGP
ncbi:cobalamin biosynthesis protein [Salinactinospora qingdaonensis]|uniref:Cobalamin biosynthesis protein CobD n=1 Tax=Salinactinospora qingdaonensis TaxID=702744 RepID=A0ABP7EZL7_9ACTN